MVDQVVEGKTFKPRSGDPVHRTFKKGDRVVYHSMFGDYTGTLETNGRYHTGVGIMYGVDLDGLLAKGNPWYLKASEIDHI